VAFGPGPDNLAVDSDRRHILLAALDGLAPDHRAVLRLRVLEGGPPARWRNSSIAAKAAVRQLQVRALAALRVALGHELSSFTIESEEDERDPR